jgi:hypothetical protein
MDTIDVHAGKKKSRKHEAGRQAEMAFQVMMMKKTMSRKRGRLRGSLKTAKGKKGIKIQPKVTDGVGNHTSMFSSQLHCDMYCTEEHLHQNCLGLFL